MLRTFKEMKKAFNIVMIAAAQEAEMPFSWKYFCIF